MNTLHAIIEPNGEVKFLQELDIKKPTKAIITFVEDDQNFTEIMSESAFAKDWSKPEEDDAWAYLQQEQ